MEKIFKSEFIITRNEDSNLVLDTKRDLNKKFLYQARDVGYEYNEKGYYHKRENGIVYLAVYTKSGEAIFERRGESITLKAGSLLFVSLAEKTVIKAPNSHWEIYFMHVIGSDIDSIYRTFAQKHSYVIENFCQDYFVSCVDKLCKLYKETTINYYDISSLIYSALMDILKQSPPSEYSPTVIKALEYMNGNYVEKFSIDDLCKSLFLSKYFFTRKFHSETGVTPKEYLTNLRIEKARELLIHSKRSVAEIAQIAGFETEKNIYYAFKKSLGVSPKEYRENFV